MRPSLSLVISCVFLALILHSIYNLILLYSPPYCKPDEVCYTSYLNKKPNLELLVYASDSSRNTEFNQILHIDRLEYDKPLETTVQIEITKAVRNNGSIYIHSILIPERTNKRRISLNEAKSIPDSSYIKNKLTKYAIPKSSTFNLLQEETKTQSIKPVSHLKSKFAIVICNELLNIPHNNIPMELLKYMRINSKREFLPIVMQDLLQTRLKDLEEITENNIMNFTYIYNPISIGKFKFLVQMEGTFINFMQLGFTDKDVDEVKGVFADTNLYLLCATMLIGGIHLLLDFLSFKNDVSFWKSHKSMAGLSIRSVLWRSFSQTIVFLYLLDEGTSLLVLIPSGIGMLIEFWKVTKVFKITITWTGIKINNKNVKETADEAKTKQYDRESMKYLSYVLYPMVACAAVYSLIYQPHKSWYSWTINSMVNGVYVFGFLFMLPQLFINYRLKSVAALPWRAFTYRAFNTFIDDIFAFIITMPTAHRIACFRDDVVFLIYLYQRWLYPVDKSRVDDGTGDVIETSVEDKKIK